MVNDFPASVKANSPNRPGSRNIAAGWTGIAAGVGSGVALGAFFHRSEFMGGYSSFRRRLVRLGHISFFGLGILNILYGLTAARDADGRSDVAGLGLIVGAVTMPAVCFGTAWRKPMRHLFAIPVGAVLLAVLPAASRSLRQTR